MDTKLDTDIAIEVLADGAVRIAKLIKKAAGISIIVTIVDPDDRQASGKTVDQGDSSLHGAHHDANTLMAKTCPL